MKGIQDINKCVEYLERLCELKDRYIILMAIQWESGPHLTADIAAKVQALGVKTDLSQIGDASYIAVLDDGLPVYEETGAKCEALWYKRKYAGIDIDIVSKSKSAKRHYHQSSRVGIAVNEELLTFYKRGLSIAVYDKYAQKVIDSVTFDTCTPDIFAFRAENHYRALLGRISELNAGFGYTVAQWLFDNCFSSVNILIEPQFTELIQAVALPIKMHDGIMVSNYFTTSSQPFMLEYNFEAYFLEEWYTPLDVSKVTDGQAVIYISPFIDLDIVQEINKTGSVIFTLGELIDNAVAYMEAEEVILKLVAEVPGVYAASYSLLMLKDDNSDQANYIREKRIEFPGILSALKNGKRDSECVSPYIREDKIFSNDEWIEMMCYPEPESYTDVKGYRVWKDRIGKQVNIINGHRVTSFQPEIYDNTVYILGGCNEFGIYNSDHQTFSSQLQKLLNEKTLNGKIYRVENYSHFSYKHWIDIRRVIRSVKPKEGDILLWLVYPLAPNYNKYSQFPNFSFNKEQLCNCGYLFHDCANHYTANMHKIIAQMLYDNISNPGFLSNQPNYEYKTRQIPLGGLFGADRSRGGSLALEYRNKLEEYKTELRAVQEQATGRIGSIVMNCNPFTLGHRHLIEHAASKVKHLYIFAVEEDRSIFPFSDRFELIKAGTADISNVTVLPSGQFIISSLTFSDYFQKTYIQDRTIDPSQDVELFAAEIAPTLGISVRFAGEEPLDLITKQYNDAMKRILPQYGIKFEVIPRKEQDGKIISASRVRKLLEEKDFDSIAKIVPETTLKYLKRRWGL